MKKFAFLACFLWWSIIAVSQAQYRYTVIHYFNNLSGEIPYGSLSLSNGMLYGMTSSGGASDSGCIFSTDTAGASYTNILNFNGINGATPQGSLTLAGTTLFGMTSEGGANGKGCVFSIKTNGSSYHDLLDFDSTNGANPQDNVIISGDTLYGMTLNGGVHGLGLIFAVDTDGSNYRDLLDFDSANGSNPYGSLTLAGNILFGMTFNGGDTGVGLIFSIHTDGNGYKDLHDFGNASRSGLNPNGSLILSGNLLYGLTRNTNGGINAGGVAFKIDTDGNNFKKFFNLSYANVDRYPSGSFVLVDSLLYGMTFWGLSDYRGGVFSIDTVGAYTEIYQFHKQMNGFSGCKSLTASGTEFYGMASYGADSNNGLPLGGVIFKLVDTGIYYPQVTMNIGNVSCNGGSNGVAVANVSGGVSPYTYLWQPSGNTTDSTGGLSAGTYTLSVTGNNDSTTTVLVTINEPVMLTMLADSLDATVGNCDGSAWVIVNGGTSPYTYSWTGGLTTDTISNQCTGNYCCTVTNLNGCIDSICVFIDVSTSANELKAKSEELRVFPNPNDGKFELGITNYELGKNYSVEIYNVLGEQVFSSFLIPNSQFLLNLSSQPDGVYFYRVLSENGGLIGEGKLVIVK